MPLKFHPRLLKEFAERQKRDAELTQKRRENKLAGILDPDVQVAIDEEIARRQELGETVTGLCPKVYAAPNYAAGEQKYCLRDLYTCAGKTYTRCFQHGHEDREFRAPLCKNGKNYPAHKRGIHPAVCPKDPDSGLCYFCLKEAERAYVAALVNGDEPAPLIAVAASVIYKTFAEDEAAEPDEDADEDADEAADEADEDADKDADEKDGETPRQETPLMSGRFLHDVILATRDVGLTQDTLSFESVHHVYMQAVARGELSHQILAACNFLHFYLSQV